MKGKTLLLVEDSEDDRELTLRVLRKFNIGNSVAVARDGVEALDYLFLRGEHAAPHPAPAIVLLDLKLPKIDGLEVLRQIRANPATATQPVVVLTSSKEEQDLVSSYRLGANSYVRKPVEFGEFCDAIQKLGFYWLLVNEPAP